jgi:hypothetical protein
LSYLVALDPAVGEEMMQTPSPWASKADVEAARDELKAEIAALHANLAAVHGNLQAIEALLTDLRDRRLWWRRLFAAVAGIVLAGVCISLASAAEQVSSGPVWVLANGTESCGKFLGREEVLQKADALWILGYISGANSRSESYRMIGQSIHDAGTTVVEWARHYCQEHPLDPLVNVAEALRFELIKREGQQ